MAAPGSVFVGRERELGELHAGLDDAVVGRGRLFLITGEPGIGKTRLADELSTAARGRGALVVWGRCCETGGAPAFWPWTQALRPLVQASPSDVIAAQLGSGAPYAAQLVPELCERVPGVGSAPASLSSEHARFYLFDAVATWLKNAAATRPLVLVFDDLHSSDVSSLGLLQFVARGLRDARVLVIGTYREFEARQQPEVAAIIDEVARDGHVLPLAGLSEADVAGMVRRSFATPLADSVVSSIYRTTEGNPLFVDEVVRWMLAERVAAHAGQVPPRIRAAIRRRLALLAGDTLGVLSVAAVIGRDFEIGPLREIANLSEARVIELLGEAVGAGVVGPIAGELRRYRFFHVVLRETLYEEIGAAQRARLHRQIGEALERLSSAEAESHAAALAHHFMEAAPVIGAEKAIAYAARAGEECARRFAYEDAAAHYQTALQALALDSAGSATRGAALRRCDLLLALGDVRACAGQSARARATFLQAAEQARTLDTPELLARAALGFAGRADLAAKPDIQQTALLEEALAALADETSALRARLLSRLAMDLYLSPDRARREQLSRQAVETAERVGEPQTLAIVLSDRRWALLGPGNFTERLAAAQRICDLAAPLRSEDLELAGEFWRMLDALELGDRSGFDRALQRYGELAERLRHPFYIWRAAVVRTTGALLEGRFEEGERLVHDALQLGIRAESPNAMLSFGTQLFGLRRDQGRLRELEPVLDQFAGEFQAMPGFRCGLALLYCDTERTAEARTVFEELAADDFRVLPLDGSWLASLAALAEVCVRLGDARRAATLYDLLLPYASQNIVVSFCEACDGAVSRYLGLLAATMGRCEDAGRHFEAALVMHARIRARPLLAHTQRAYAEMLRARGDLNDRRKGQQLLERAAAMYEQLGMRHYQDLVRAAPAGASGETAGVSAVERPCPGQERARNVLRKEADYWTLGYEGAVVRLKDAKGLHYIAFLVRHAGTEFHVADLVAAADAGLAPARMTAAELAQQGLRVARPADARSLPDARAKTEYRRRLADLREELEEAERFNDPGRGERARDEMELITRELASAYGFDGSARRINEPIEKLRKAVTNRIRDQLMRIRRAHPVLGQHLFNSIKTGTFCSYTPERPTDWVLE